MKFQNIPCVQSIAALGLLLALSACVTPIEKRHYPQSQEHIEYYRQLFQNKSSSQIAQEAADEMNRQIGGKAVFISRALASDKVYAHGDTVIYQYRFLYRPSQFALNNMEKSMRNDLLSRTCQIPTVRMAFQKGMKEKHIYMLDERIAFQLEAHEQACQSAGL